MMINVKDYFLEESKRNDYFYYSGTLMSDRESDTGLGEYGILWNCL